MAIVHLSSSTLDAIFGTHAENFTDACDTCGQEPLRGEKLLYRAHGMICQDCNHAE